MIVYTAMDFVKWAKVAAAAVEQCYCNSDFGSNLCDPAILDQYTHETSWDRTHAAETTAKANAAKAAGVPLWGWDCVNLVKGILWGWTCDTTQARGGAKYKSNGVPDATIEDLYKNYCTDQSTDFSHIEIGEFVVYSKSFGHCGIYIGGGYVIEATTKWDSKVQITRILNVAKSSGEYPEAESKTRTWWAHGKLPWIDYSEQIDGETGVIKCPCCGQKLTINLTPANVHLYIVKSGNTLWSIARDELGSGTRWPEIARLNGIIEGQGIMTGQKLYIPNK